MDSITIGEVAHKAGVRPSAIRYYESAGLLPVPQRVNGQRRYEPNVLQRIGMIQTAQHAGFTISEIRTLLNDFPADTPPSERWHVLASQKLIEVEALIERANTMKMFLERALQCRCLTLEECIVVDENSEGALDIEACGEAKIVSR